MLEPIIGIEHLSNAFGGARAVQDLFLQVRRSELVAFLGVNGAANPGRFPFSAAPGAGSVSDISGWLLNAAQKQKL